MDTRGRSWADNLHDSFEYNKIIYDDDRSGEITRSSYLGHVADHDGHDDAINGYSFTEDDAAVGQKQSYWSQGVWNGCCSSIKQQAARVHKNLTPEAWERWMTMYLTKFLVLIRGAFTPPPMMLEPVM